MTVGMAFELLVGQQTQRNRLMEALTQGRLAHAYLFHGPPGTGADALAIEMAKAVNCESGPGEPCQACRSCRKITSLRHPDVHVYLPSSSAKATKEDASDADDDGEDRAVKMDARTERRIRLTAQLAENNYAPLDLTKNDFLSVDDIRGLRQEASVKPYEGRRKVALILAADRMNIAASNALLKTLEEPPGELLLLLTTARVHRLLPTILSRCQPVHLSRLSEETIRTTLIERYHLPEGKARLGARQADGSLSGALARVSVQGEKPEEMAFSFFQSIHGGDLLALFEAVETVTAAHKVQPMIEALLDMLIEYYRELFLLKVTPDTSELFHPDRLEVLRPIAQGLSLERIESGISSIEFTKFCISRNAQTQLALTVMALRLRPESARVA